MLYGLFYSNELGIIILNWLISHMEIKWGVGLIGFIKGLISGGRTMIYGDNICGMYSAFFLG